MKPCETLASVAWQSIRDGLDDEGYAVTPPLLDAGACRRLEALYDDRDIAFRSVIDMARYNFGIGEYKYFAYPLPAAVQAWRDAFYGPLAAIANDWAVRLRSDTCWPTQHQSLLERCHAAGQSRPTPLMLRYVEGGYNCLHQDLYGPIHFPLQVVIQLSRPARDFEGGELVLVEQRPRMQSRPIVIRLEQGAAAVIPVRERPRRGKRGFYRAQMRHGVARLTRGRRTTLGLIFHDAA